MMVRYHTGETVLAEPECATARAVARLSEEDPDFEDLQPTLDLRVSDAGGGDVRLEHALAPENAVVVSQGVVDVLGSFFARRLELRPRWRELEETTSVASSTSSAHAGCWRRPTSTRIPL
jgi:hypothetical protein